MQGVPGFVETNSPNLDFGWRLWRGGGGVWTKAGARGRQWVPGTAELRSRELLGGPGPQGGVSTSEPCNGRRSSTYGRDPKGWSTKRQTPCVRAGSHLCDPKCVSDTKIWGDSMFKGPDPESPGINTSKPHLAAIVSRNHSKLVDMITEVCAPTVRDPFS